MWSTRKRASIFLASGRGLPFHRCIAVIGDIETFSITEGFRNRAEAGYTRSVHQFGDQPTTAATPLGLSNLWNYSGMNVFHGKVVAFKDGQFGAVDAGYRDRRRGAHQRPLCFGRGQQDLTGTDKSYTNGDVYVAVTKTWAKPPVPFLLNLGWKATNGTIFGIGGQSTRFGGRFFGGLGIPLPLGHGIVAVPSAGFTQEPKTSVNLNTLLNAALYQCRSSASLQTCNPACVPADERAYSYYAGLRGARDAEGQAAFRLRHRRGTGGGKHRIDLCPNPFFNPLIPAVWASRGDHAGEPAGAACRAWGLATGIKEVTNCGKAISWATSSCRGVPTSIDWIGASFRRLREAGSTIHSKREPRRFPPCEIPDGCGCLCGPRCWRCWSA